MKGIVLLTVIAIRKHRFQSYQTFIRHPGN